MDETLKDVTIQTAVLDPTGQELARLPEIVLTDLKVDVRREGKLIASAARLAKGVAKRGTIATLG